MGSLDGTQVRIAGTGNIWKAPLNTPLPTDSTTALSAAYRNLGYATDGFDMKQTKKTQPITAWQTLEVIRLITQSVERSFTFELLQTNIDTLAFAWGGATIAPAAVSIGTATIAITTGVVTTSAPHGLAIGDAVKLQGITGAAPLVSGTTYYVISVPTSTTLTLALTLGGALIATTTAGTATGVTKNTGVYTLNIPEAGTDEEFVLVIDWSDGALSQRIVVQRAQCLTFPDIKGGRQDAIKYPMEVQALKPADGSLSVKVFGVDGAVSP
jgi:hypothetical protein